MANTTYSMFDYCTDEKRYVLLNKKKVESVKICEKKYMDTENSFYVTQVTMDSGDEWSHKSRTIDEVKKFLKKLLDTDLTDEQLAGITFKDTE